MTFAHLESIYRNYDIRGKYPNEINEEEVKKIGAAIVKKFGTKKVAVGRDNRPSADALFYALAYGILSESCDVIDLGIVTTPMSYFAAQKNGIDATVMITASHMPSAYNGLKITVEDAKPVPKESLKEIEKLVDKHAFSDSIETSARIHKHSLKDEWRNYFLDRISLGERKIKVVIDPANMVGIEEIYIFSAFAPRIEVSSIFDTYDHRCPNHEANPMKTETLHSLGKEVKRVGADLGIAFDGDADRIGVVDENGEVVTSDIVGALLCESILTNEPGVTIIYDPRSSKSVPETVLKFGGNPIEWKVGHTFIRSKMREHNAALGIELAGHFFFKETSYSEGGPLAALLLIEKLSHSNKTLSSFVSEIKKYHHSGEINSEIQRTPEEIYSDLVNAFPEATESSLDGLKLETDQWWCNVRPSANDPVMRMNAEAVTKEILDDKVETILSIIRK